MTAFNGTGAHGYRRADHLLDTEKLHRQRARDNIDDRIDRADLVEMHLGRRTVVDCAFSRRQTIKNTAGAYFCRLRNRCCIDDVENISKIPPTLVMVVMMMVGVRRHRIAVDGDLEVLGADAVANGFFDTCLPAFARHIDPRELLMEFRRVGSGIEQGSGKHVTGNAGSWIEEQSFHNGYSTIPMPFVVLYRVIERKLPLALDHSHTRPEKLHDRVR